MKNELAKEKLIAKGWKFTVNNSGHIATHKTGIREFAPTLSKLIKKISTY